MKIEKCPFCGKEVAETSNCKELCRHFEGCLATEPYVCVVCNVHEGGCGASSGYYDSAEKAIAAWNRRVGSDTNVPTNADRIRSMSDKELHKFLLDFEAGDVDYAKTFCDLCCKDAALEQRSTDCEGCLLRWLKNDTTLPQGIDWLKQPVKEE